MSNSLLNLLNLKFKKVDADDMLDAKIIKNINTPKFNNDDNDNDSNDDAINNDSVGDVVTSQQTIIEVPAGEKKKKEKEPKKSPSIAQQYIDERALVHAARNKKKAEIEELKNQLSSVISTRQHQKNNQQLNLPQELPQQSVIEEVISNEELIDTYNEVVVDNVDLSDEVNLVEIFDELDDITETTADNTDIDLGIDDFVIVEVPGKKDKGGYSKVNVSVKSEKFSEIKVISFNRFLSNLNKLTDSIVEHRITDIRVMNNTNKTQLKNSELKLSGFCLTLKPIHTKLKVSKFKRIIINFEPDGVNVFIQDSREKSITNIPANKLSSAQEFEEFLAELVYDFYFAGGYSAVIIKIKNLLSGELAIKSDFFSLGKIITSSNKYIIKFKQKDLIDEILIRIKGGANEWLLAKIKYNQLQQKVTILASSTFAPDWVVDLLPNEEKQTLTYVKNNILKVLDNAFSKKDWNVIGNDKSDKELELLYANESKLTYIPMKKAYRWLLKEIEAGAAGENKKNFVIDKVLSKLDTKDLFATDNMGRETEPYNAEVIIGNSKELEYFVLGWMAIPIIGGDRRHGSQVITTDDYRSKYGVNADTPYQTRQKLNKDKTQKLAIGKSLRNYNARKYMFQLEYKSKINKKAETLQFTDVKVFIDVLMKTD